MVTTVTLSKDKRKPEALTGMDEVQDRLVMARRCIDRVREFIDDPSQDELFNLGFGPGAFQELPPERVEKMVKTGLGISGISTVIEPVDLELYRSYMYPPLSMPEKPEVMISYWDMNATGNQIMRFLEGRVMVKAKCPDGKESWLVISVPVPTFYICLEGVSWGWPKYVADEMTFTPTKAEVIYEEKVRLSMELTPGGVDEDVVKELKERGRFEWGNEVSFHPAGGGACLIRQAGRRGNAGFKVPDWEAGMVKVYMRPEDPWAGLIPTDSITPGVYQRIIEFGGGDAVTEKVKG